MKPNIFLVVGIILSISACKNTTNTAKFGQLYNEPCRPQYHFSPSRNWMNDPNGLVYYDGEYHLFYQHFPDGNTWGPMHWGHAISNDLISWQHYPISLYPDTLAQDNLITGILRWYEQTELPVFKPQIPVKDFTTPPIISNSTLCHASNTNWTKGSGYNINSDERKERCRR